MSGGLKARREALGLSQGQLAKKSGVARTMICAFEKDETIALGWETRRAFLAKAPKTWHRRAVMLAKFFGCEPAELFPEAAKQNAVRVLGAVDPKLAIGFLNTALHTPFRARKMLRLLMGQAIEALGGEHEGTSSEGADDESSQWEPADHPAWVLRIQRLVVLLKEPLTTAEIVERAASIGGDWKKQSFVREVIAAAHGTAIERIEVAGPNGKIRKWRRIG